MRPPIFWLIPVLGMAGLASCSQAPAPKGAETAKEPGTRPVGQSPRLPIAAPASEPAKSAPDARRVVITERCLLACTWLEQMCSDTGGKTGKDCTDKACRAACVDRAKIEAVLGFDRPADWGHTKKLAIEVCMPRGQRAFLDDLRCTDGSAPAYRRHGSLGSRNPRPPGAPFSFPSFSVPLKPGEVDTHIVDLYEVRCPDKTFQLYFDMYHCIGPQPWEAPRGFTRPLPSS